MTWVVFDLNGTLTDPASLEGALGGDGWSGLGEQVLDDAIAQAMTDSLAGDYRPFPDYLRAALRRRLALEQRPLGRVDEAMSAAAALAPHPEARQALNRLRDAGLELAVLTNSARRAAEATLAAAGLRGCFEHVMGSDDVRAYKPSAAMYAMAVERLSVPAQECWMAAAHGWDILGAATMGMRTAWVARKERLLLDTVPDPDVQGADLLEVAGHILAAERIGA